MEFDIPKGMSSIIKVIGVGGGGSNAVNHMFNQGIVGVDFIVCNTDRQALDISPVPHKIQLGLTLTEGRGAGMIPEVGMNAAIENIEELREVLSKNTKMVFVTAGMGGGTGTGAAPVIAQVAKDLGILTVGIVTIPFDFEGRKRRLQAEEGLEKMRQNVDTLLIINNEKLRAFGKNMALTKAFAEADNILTVAAKGIAEVISVTGMINVDFNDVNTVLRNSGHAIMGSAIAEGENRAIEAVQAALNSPLLNENDILGAKYVLLNITYGDKEVMMDEITNITDFIQDAAGATADVIWGHGYDQSLGDNISITLIATGFSSTPYTGFETLPERKLITLGDENKKEIMSQLVSPIDSPIENMSDVLAKEPFLKDSEVSSENEAAFVSETILPLDSTSAVNDEISEEDAPFLKTNEGVDESTLSSNDSNKISYDLFDSETNSGDDYSFELNQDEISNASIDANDAESSSDNESGSPVVWNIEDDSTLNKSEPSSDVKAPEIIRHVLEDDLAVNYDESKAQAILSPEEQQRKSDERNAKILQYTQKLKMPDGITEFENEPAFVRRNIQVNLDTPSSENPISRFGLSDDDAGSGLRNNNFLHDNVD
jgi:cell division protein FtsZ